MLHITSLDDGLDIFKALGSDVRSENTADISEISRGCPGADADII